jgi:hypothetical protein
VTWALARTCWASREEKGKASRLGQAKIWQGFSPYSKKIRNCFVFSNPFSNKQTKYNSNQI